MKQRICTKCTNQISVNDNDTFVACPKCFSYQEVTEDGMKFLSSFKNSNRPKEVCFELGQSIRVNGRTYTITGITQRNVIWAVPQMLRSYVMPQQKSDFLKDFSYSPWMVANIQTKPFDTGRGQAPSWDNVIYEGNGLGYVLSNHQELAQYPKTWQLTYYKPLADLEPAEERKRAIAKTHEDWKNEVLNDLRKAHPKIEESILKIDIKLWRHAMVRPTIGFIHGQARHEAQQSLNNKIHFSHSDLSGVSIFEEAFFHGTEVVKKVLKNSHHGGTD